MLEVVIEERLYNSDINIEETSELTTILIDEVGVLVVPISEEVDNQVERKVDGVYVPLPYRTPVEQTTGDSEESVMSQKAVTDEITTLTLGVTSLQSGKVDKVVGESLITDAELIRLSTVTTDATKNSEDSYLLDRVNHTGEQPISSVTSLFDELLSKVDKEVGKLLSSNDYTDEEKAKLLDVAIEATKNQSDAYLLSRVNHTGEQPISSVTGLETSLLNKVDRVTGKQLSTNDFTDALKIKLDLMAADATKNKSDSFLLNRENHYGSQTINSIENLIPTLNTKVDRVAGKVLSDNNYTDGERDKLAGLEGSKFRGVFTSLLELQAGVTTPQAGYYAQVDTGLGSDAIQYIYDVSDDKWIAQESATPITASQVKQMYESNPNTNALTDDMAAIVNGVQDSLDGKVDKEVGMQLSQESFTTEEKLKLGGVAVEATKNASDASLRDRSTHSGTQPINTVEGLSGALESKVDVVVGKELSTQTLPK